MATILFIRIFLVSDGSDTSGVLFPFTCRKTAEILSTWLHTDLDVGFMSSQPGSGLSISRGQEHKQHKAGPGLIEF